jgi:hypothetical protein
VTAMSRLAPAHRGYEYQDLLVACRFVDILLIRSASATAYPISRLASASLPASSAKAARRDRTIHW